jgi:hypothetical protein
VTKFNPATDVEPEVVRKSLGLTPEQQAAIDLEDSAPFESLTPDQQRRRKQREAKRKERKGKQAAKAEAQAAKVEEAIRQSDTKLTIGKFWAKNRDRLDEDTRAQYVQLHEQVLDQLAWMWDWMHGTYDVKPEEVDFYVSLEEGYSDMEKFVAEHGVVYGYDLGLFNITAKSYDRPGLQNVELYKDDWEFRTSMQQNVATRIWLSCGLLLALPNEFVNLFRKFYSRSKHGTQETNQETI